VDRIHKGNSVISCSPKEPVTKEGQQTFQKGTTWRHATWEDKTVLHRFGEKKCRTRSPKGGDNRGDRRKAQLQPVGTKGKRRQGDYFSVEKKNCPDVRELNRAPEGLQERKIYLHRRFYAGGGGENSRAKR